jgi:hypothetical protein
MLAVSLFPNQVVGFPLKYLGIPLSVKLLKSALQQLVDKVADKLQLSLERSTNES